MGTLSPWPPPGSPGCLIGGACAAVSQAASFGASPQDKPLGRPIGSQCHLASHASGNHAGQACLPSTDAAFISLVSPPQSPRERGSKRSQKEL